MAERLEEILVKLAEENLKLKQELRDNNAAQAANVNRIVGALGDIIQAPPNEAAVRAKNLLLMRKDLRKSQRCKNFTEKQEMKPQEWVKRLEEELEQQRDLCNVPAPLTRAEWIPCFKDKIEFDTRERLETAMANMKPAAYTWDAVTEAQIKTLLIAEFGKIESKVSEVLIQFGPNRFRKPADMGVATFYHKFVAQLPVCMLPTSDDEHKEFADLIKRSLFYLNLDDKNLQEELCKLKEEDQSLPKFLEEAVKAEAHRKAFVEIGNTGAQLDTAQGVSVSQWDAQWHKSSRQGQGYGRKGQQQSSQKGQQSSGKSEKNWAEKSVDAGSARPPAGQQVKQQPNKSNQSSQSGTRPKRRNGDCHFCGIRGHWARDCFKNPDNKNPDKKSDKKLQKTDVVVNKDDGECSEGEIHNFNALQVITETDVKSVRTEARSHLTTNEPIMTSVSLEDAIIADFECDTAASHSVMSDKLYSQLRKKLGGLPGKKQDVVIKLADGTISNKSYGTVQVSVKAHGTQPVLVTFFVIEGPNSLLGRYALELLWPREYEALRQRALESAEAMSLKKPQHPVQQVGVQRSHQSRQSAPAPALMRTGEMKNCHVQQKPQKPVVETVSVDPKCMSHQQKLVDQQEDTTELQSALSACVHESPICKYSVNQDSGAAAAEQSADCVTSQPQPPAKRKLPPPPKGKVTQEEGEAYCRVICDTYPEVFDGGKGNFRGAEATMHIKPGHMEQVQNLGVGRPAKIPYGLEDDYNVLLDDLYEDCVPIDGHELITASQVVPVCVVKDGKKVIKRLAINYKRTINDHLADMPHVYTSCNEELDKLCGEYRTCIDLKGAFKQIMVTPGFSQKILAIVTPRGYAIPQRMQFGIKTAPGIWNANMQRLIHGQDGKEPVKAAVIVDDVCVTGDSPEEHFANLHEFIYRLFAAGLKANISKCKFYQNQVKFLGKIVDRDGIRLDPATTEAIVEMPRPKDKSRLRSFLGHMSYIGRHVPGLREARAPLDALLKPEAKYDWSPIHDKAFNTCKGLAGNSARLLHFDPQKPIVLTTDASPHGLGACLSHKVEVDGKMRLQPVAYASCSLKPSEKSYAQVDREGLAVYWAVKHFKQYLWCYPFELHTDCSALLKIFGPKNDLGGCASGRLNRWAVSLMEYSFVIKHIKGTSNSAADNLSRLPVSVNSDQGAAYPSGSMTSLTVLPDMKMIDGFLNEDQLMGEIKSLAVNPVGTCQDEISVSKVIGSMPNEAWDILPLTLEEVATKTREDKLYGRLLKSAEAGVLDNNDKELRRFSGVFDDLYIEDGVVYFGSRVVIPTCQQARLLEELHFIHIGAVRMKYTVRRYFWWPGITADIDKLANSCSGCRKFRKKPSPNTLCPWPFSRRPMERVHIDFFEFKGRMVLLMIDSFSKKIWLHYMHLDTTTEKTLAILWGWFCSETGFPTTLVSDNGPQLVSKEFEDKMKKWGINHLVIPPYHPASNGLAERAVGICKDRLKKMGASGKPTQLHNALKYICRVQGLTPNTSTGRCPYELIKMGPLPSLFPKLCVSSKQRQKAEKNSVPQAQNKIKPMRHFNEDDKVVVYDNFKKLNSPGIVKEVLGKNNYLVEIDGLNKHVSGDCMSYDKSTNISEVDETCDLQDLSNENLNDILDEVDVISIVSDSTVDSDILVAHPPPHNVQNVRPNRARRMMLQRLGSPPQLQQRLRTRH